MAEIIAFKARRASRSRQQPPKSVAELPFVRVTGRGKHQHINWWAVQPSGDLVQDTKRGVELGVACLEYFATHPSDMTIVHIAAAQMRAVKRHGGKGWTLVSSFWAPILAAIAGGHRVAPPGFFEGMADRQASEIAAALRWHPSDAARPEEQDRH